MYWVGKMNDQYVIYDPNVQLDESIWVSLYFRAHKNYVPYVKNHARNIITRISPTHEEYSRTVNSYEEWLQKDKELKITDAIDDIKNREIKSQKRIKELKASHRNHVEQAGTKYLGVSQAPKAQNVRTTVCYSCHKTISSDINLKCNSCGWIVCSSCGVCGCGYEK